MTHPFFERRQTGVLLHPSSLPGGHGIGDVGPAARAFVDWLARAGVGVWQVLPLAPPGGPRGDIPYASWASMACDPRLLSLEDLVQDGLLEVDELPPPGGDEYDEAGIGAKVAVLARAATRVRERFSAELERFHEEAEWARTAAELAAARARHGGPWWSWPAPLRDRLPTALAALEGHPEYARTLALQFIFQRQWQALRGYAAARGVRLLGDVSIYVLHDSADVWSQPEGWKITRDGRLLAKSGAPPDVFSADGQLWGGPVYDWANMAADDFGWWQARLRRAFELADVVRIDHFRAFAAYWEIPAEATTAAAGDWSPGPGLHFFERMRAALGDLPLCVEDLGAIDDDVHALRDAIGAPGMRVLHYGFGSSADNLHLPHNVPEDAIVYPGNHDNDTTWGWWHGLQGHTRAHVQHYLGRHGDDIAWDLNRAALACPARLAILQMQDVLSLGGEARMNDPAAYARPPETWHNWRWRMAPGAATEALAERLRFLADLYGRV